HYPAGVSGFAAAPAVPWPSRPGPVGRLTVEGKQHCFGIAFATRSAARLSSAFHEHILGLSYITLFPPWQNRGCHRRNRRALRRHGGGAGRGRGGGRAR